jgi:PHD/YefM family antitoxin component YafN of YafNO toxin-antitoxin module
MIKLHERYVVASNGEQVGVLLPVARYRKLLEEFEELEAIRAYDAAKASADKSIPFRQAKTSF